MTPKLKAEIIKTLAWYATATPYKRGMDAGDRAKAVLVKHRKEDHDNQTRLSTTTSNDAINTNPGGSRNE